MTEKLHNYFYKITNLVNGKYYYGIHSTNNLDDGYMGSGKVLLAAIKKHSKKKFTKEIIVDYPTRREVNEHEKRVVTVELVNLEECYNTRTGGDNDFIPSEKYRKKLSMAHLGKTLTEDTKKKMSENRKGEKHPMYGVKGKDNPNFGKKASEQVRKRLSELQVGENNSFFGKTHSDTSKKKISEAQMGFKNHNFGKSVSEGTKDKLRNNTYCKPCCVFGIRYFSVKEAARQLKLPENTVRNRLNSKNYGDWLYVEKRI